MRRGESVMNLALALGAGIFLWEARRLSIGWTIAGPGAGFFPFYLALGVFICALILVIQSVRTRATAAGPDEPFIPAGAWKPLLIVLLPMMAVVAFIDYFGIYIGGAIYLAGYMRLVGRHRWLAVVLVSVLVPLALFYIFEKWFLLPMPKGRILEYLLYER